ncbi:hypothetical protein J3R82DRAFT_10068 [Butyriboletus roseoflavus]|nr:hypothetical protein J3R82DRAFT_10068 [Butyriboletus roseoflavus]
MAQPPPSRLAPRGLLSLPYRLCNPPPAVGKVRSCSFTPVLNVRLEDVLARRHLPPIGLKDLEEYLLYVEHAPENLYFILWLKDYTARYHAWAQREKTSLFSKKNKMPSQTQRQKFPVPPTPDPALAMYYLRAKQTFFTPNGEYELNIPSDILAPFHTTPPAHVLHTHPQDHSRSLLWHSQSVHPDPAVFTEVAIEARNMLNESLHRFVRAAYTNVGSQRAICGIIAGCLFTLVAGVLPLVLTIGRWNHGPHKRLIRLVAFPGLWLGLTILIASLQGICLMVYIFGDLRQLRKYELARPTISRPMPIPIPPPTPSRSTHASGQTLFIPPHSAPMQEKTIGATSSLDSPTSFLPPARPRAQFSDASLATTSCESCESEVCSSIGCNEIDVSPAFFDDVPAPEGPATASCLHRPEYRLPPTSIAYLEPAHLRPEAWSTRVSISGSAAGSPVMVDPSQSMRSPRSSTKGPSEYGPTAGFIPNDYSSNSASSLSDTSRSLRSQRSARCFDFDLLPANMVTQRHHSTGGGDSAPLPAGGTNLNIAQSPSVIVDPSGLHPSAPAPLLSPTLTDVGPFLGRAQYKCNQRTSPAFKPSPPDEESATSPPPKRFWLTLFIPSFTAGVPAFATPLTQIQSAAVKRAQWEVVVRAGFSGAVITGVLTGIAVGVVP